MKPGKTEKVKLKPGLADGVAVSNQFGIAVIDAGNQDAECDEDNNVRFVGPLEQPAPAVCIRIPS